MLLLLPAGIANENIKWETTTITDFGFDASFFKGRLSTTFDWYNKVTNDILLQLPMPGIFLGYLSKQFKISQVADIKELERFFILQQPSVCSAFAPQVYPYIFPRCLPDSYT